MSDKINHGIFIAKIEKLADNFYVNNKVGHPKVMSVKPVYNFFFFRRSIKCAICESEIKLVEALDSNGRTPIFMNNPRTHVVKLTDYNYIHGNLDVVPKYGVCGNNHGIVLFRINIISRDLADRVMHWRKDSSEDFYVFDEKGNCNYHSTLHDVSVLINKY